MRLREAENHEQASVNSGCCYNWIVDCSQDGVSEGHCKSCGEQRTFESRVSFLSEREHCAAESDEWNGLRR
jgi:hypothetical protein